MLSAMYARWLAATALAYGVLHHLGVLPGGRGSTLDDTRRADWLDLAVPWLVLVPAALTVQAAWWGWTRRRELGGVLAVGFAPAAVVLVGAVAGIG